jgi:peptidyl-prolyl cis-trans isomerase-like protein 2
MGKKRRDARARFAHVDVSADSAHRSQFHSHDPTAFDFEMCSLTYLPLSNPLICRFGYAFSKAAIQIYLSNHDRHPFVEAPLALSDLTEPHFTFNSDGYRIDPITEKVLSTANRIVMIASNGNCYDAETVAEFNIKANMLIDLLSGQPFRMDDVVVIHDSGRRRMLPPMPIVSAERGSATSEVVRKSREFVRALGLAGEALESHDQIWYLARPTQQALAAASEFKQRGVAGVPKAVITTSHGEFVIELDVGEATLACVNFIGHAFQRHYDGVRVEKVEREKYFEVKSASVTDETVWTIPIAYERDDKRRGFRYPVFFVNTGNRQIHVTNTARFAVACGPVDITECHVFGGVVAGEGAVAEMCHGPVFPDGRPMQPFTVQQISIVDNPFPMNPG